MADPTLIMLDEPMAGVNPALKQSLLGHVKELKDEGRTVLFVEHDMDMVHEISDWVVVMAAGRDHRRRHRDGHLRQPGGHRRLPRRPPRSRSRRDERRGRNVGARATRGAGRRHSMTNIIECTELVAGYVPGVNILNGCDLVVATRGVRRHHRPERRRQVDVDEGGARARDGPVGLRGARWRRHHRPAAAQAGAARGRVRPADQQRVPVADRAREPRDGMLRQPEELRRLATRS